MQLEGNSYTQQEKIGYLGLKWAFIHRLSENKNVIQVVVERDQEYALMFYMHSKEKEQDNEQSGKPWQVSYELQQTKIMGKK